MLHYTLYVLFAPVLVTKLSTVTYLLIVQLVKLPKNLPRGWAEGSFEALTAGLHSERASEEEAVEGLSSAGVSLSSFSGIITTWTVYHPGYSMLLFLRCPFVTSQLLLCSYVQSSHQ